MTNEMYIMVATLVVSIVTPVYMVIRDCRKTKRKPFMECSYRRLGREKFEYSYRIINKRSIDFIYETVLLYSEKKPIDTNTIVTNSRHVAKPMELKKGAYETKILYPTIQIRIAEIGGKVHKSKKFKFDIHE